MRILIAEDDELMLKTLEFRLKKDGHTVLLARDGKEALNMIDDHLPDLVITDIMMPYSSGMEIVGFLKQKYQDKIRVHYTLFFIPAAKRFTRTDNSFGLKGFVI